jgi:multidrug efflux pump subunit AcrB
MIKASLKYRQVTIPVLLLMFILGLNSLISMPRREDPKIIIPGGLVIAWYPGANALQVEEQVTDRIEEYLFHFEEVNRDKTFSVTSDGMTVVHVWLQDNVRQPDIFWSKLRHQLLVVKAIDLPTGVNGPVVNSDFGDTETMIIGLSGNEVSYTDLKKQVIKLEDRLRQIPALSKIKMIGDQREQILVTFNAVRLAQYDISLQQIVRIMQSQNLIDPTGEFRTDELGTPLYTNGYYASIEDISNQVVGASKTGAVVRLRDVADLTRGYTEPTSTITVGGEKAVLVGIQMHEGRNVVKSGKEVMKMVDEFKKQLPAGMNLTTFINQPEIVRKNISKFLREFLLAILSVMLVVFLLLPLPIAAVSATAIPMTISITFALMHIFGIELHQVSLATLIAVLGLVVDDAIIIADNYVELLDRGNDRWTAAWRSATDLVVPVLTATITIIAAFLPLVILTGAIGDFIRALPLTVTIALSSSFLVAMFLTPILCFVFIRKGLHGREEQGKRRRSSFLDLMQSAYNKSIDWCLDHRKTTIYGSLATILLAVFLLKFAVSQKFFPEAEREQFTVELWMPTGTSLQKTGEAVKRIENVISRDPRVKSYATFTGRSAPRFYYNYSPEMPFPNYAQILINTVSKKATWTLYEELKAKAGSLIPEGLPHVKLMQQGQPLHAHIEIRIAGEDLETLKSKGNEIMEILRRNRGSDMIRSDFREDIYGIGIDVKGEASRLGYTTESISQTIYTAVNGYTVSRMDEGDNPVDIVLRLDERYRQDAGDLRDLYLQSPVTGASVPLRQIAGLVPEWHEGNINRRNGVRTLTILCETKEGILPSELLKQIKPEIEGLKLPEGYRVYFGGEYANQKETYSYMFIALIISIVAIFLVLLFQFRNLKEVGLVMLTIPLSLFGAVMGLIITGNDFGFTAFTAVISLSGIVVRNAIILIDHTNELLTKGLDIPSAARQAGKRRLRPIFLTAMAAAIGVLPMILSGSSLWSPLASVIAFGVVWSMVISTLSIPVLYSAAIKPGDKKGIIQTIKTEGSEN